MVYTLKTLHHSAIASGAAETLGRVRVRYLTLKTRSLDPQNQGFRMLDLKKQCVDLLKIRVWVPDSSEGSACEDQRCKALPAE